MITTLFAEVSQQAQASEKILIYTLIGGHVVTLVTLAIKALIDQANRIQDRLDAREKAEALLREGAEREKRLQHSIAENTRISERAFEAANGHNQKISEVVETVARVAEIRKSKD